MNISEPKKQKKDEEIRKLVRANAMRDFRKKQKEERQAAAYARGRADTSEQISADRHDRTESEEVEIITEQAVSRRNSKPSRDEAYYYGAAQLKQLLKNLESMSMNELEMTYEEEMAEHIQQISLYPGANNNALRETDWVFSSEFPAAESLVNPRTLLDSGIDPFNAAPIFGNAR